MTCCGCSAGTATRPPLGQAFAEYGRIAKTLHLLALVDPADDGYRRTVNTQLTVQESRHRLARKIFHGQRGELRQAYREGQEDQLGALGLVLNAVVLWNTRYTDAAVAALRSSGHPVADEDAARLSPLGDKHINIYLDTLQNRYEFGPAVFQAGATPETASIRARVRPAQRTYRVPRGVRRSGRRSRCVFRPRGATRVRPHPGPACARGPAGPVAAGRTHWW